MATNSAAVSIHYPLALVFDRHDVPVQLASRAPPSRVRSPRGGPRLQRGPRVRLLAEVLARPNPTSEEGLALSGRHPWGYRHRL